MDDTKAQITKIAREVNKLATRTLKLDGIGTSEFDLIHVVRKHNGITPSEICQILGTDKGAVTRQIASLLKKGYVISRPNPSDRRSRLIFPTAKAEALKVSKRHIETIFYEWLLEILQPEEKAVFVSLLDRLYHRSKEESKSGFVDVNKRIEDKRNEEK